MHDASVNSEPGSNSPLEFVTFKSQAVQRQPIANKSCWLLTLLTWINLVSYYSLWLTFWAFKMLGFNLPISNRPFAHCCQIFTERNFLVALFLLRKKQSEIYFSSLSPLWLQRYSSKSVSICQAFFKLLFKTLNSYYSFI